MSKAGYRHELKYFINQPDWALLRARLMPLMARDPNAGPSGEYTIRSLYFDDYWQSAYRDKEEGILTRHKYRIRVYDYADGVINLERKSKYDQYIRKESAPLTRSQTEAILEGRYGVLMEGGPPLLQEFYYECTSRLMRPRVVVDYEREPFVSQAGDVRITFDKHVRAGLGAFSLFDASMPTCDVLPGDRMILEVKFTSFLPGIVRRLLPPRSAERSAASKYVLCYETAVQDRPILKTEGSQWTAR